jgi:hypothetical protein
MLRPTLEILSLGPKTAIDWDLTESALDECEESTVFPSLRFLIVWAEVRALQSLIPLLDNLQGVHLQQHNSDSDDVNSVLHLLSSRRRLEEISFDSCGNVNAPHPIIS